MRRMIDVTRARRERQLAYNREHGITPQTIRKAIQESLAIRGEAEELETSVVRETGVDYNVHQVIQDLEREMLEAAEALEFERAALLRDQIRDLRGSKEAGGTPVSSSRRGDPKPEARAASRRGRPAASHLRYPKTGR
jgi:excinuclease ABC subunit B